MTLSAGNSWGSHLKDLTTPQSRPLKDDFGAKAGLLKYLRQDPELAPHILPGFYISPSQIQSGDFPDLPEEYKHKARLLYRSSNPHDAYEFIGQLPTLSGTSKTHTQTLEMIRDILTEDVLTAYLEEKGIPHQSTETGIYIQEQLSLIFRGSVVEHPHQRGVYLISHTSANHGDDIHDDKYSKELQTYDEDGNLLPHERTFRSLPNPGTLIELYKKIQGNAIFEDGISFQMEFGITEDGKFYIFQPRQFRPFQDARKCYYPPSGWTTVFGVTPEEGIDICAQSIHGRYVEYYVLQKGIQERVEGLIVPFLRKNLHPSVFKGIKFFCVGGNSHPSLEHHTYDAAMKVEYVLLSPFNLPPSIKDNYVPQPDTTYDIRHTSNGIRGTVEFQSEANKPLIEQLATLMEDLEKLTGDKKKSFPKRRDDK